MGTVEATSSTEVKPEKARRDRLNLTNGVFAVVLMLVAGLAGFYWMKLIEAISEGTTAGGSVTNGFFSVEMIVLVFLFTNVVGTVVFVTYFPPFRLYLYGTGNFTTAKRVFFLG